MEDRANLDEWRIGLDSWDDGKLGTGVGEVYEQQRVEAVAELRTMRWSPQCRRCTPWRGGGRYLDGC
ncbi:hypothetical protein V6N12_028903 [Hibiscus sabdariffa]|uniref:Uncharacterized protein n=1 Tax=Hibiscus sabdariffa TaxID=183260 RepID=A0ABR2F773_9ROSI